MLQKPTTHANLVSWCRLTDLPTSDAGPNTVRTDLLAFSAKTLLLFIGCGNGVYYLPAEALSTVNGGNLSVKNLDSNCLALSSSVKKLDCNCDGSLLSVCTDDGASPVAHVFSTEKLTRGQKDPDFRLPLSSSPQSRLIYLKWNPVEVGCCLFMDSNSVIVVVLLNSSGAVNILGTVPSSEGITCVAWSPKGKQFVAGMRDGCFAQYKITCQLYRKFPRPPDQRLIAVIDIVWLFAREFFLTYSTSSYPRENIFTFAWSTKEKPTAIEYNIFHEFPFTPKEGGAIGRCFLAPLRNHVLLISAVSVENEIYALMKSPAVALPAAWVASKVVLDSSVSLLMSQGATGCAIGDQSQLIILANGQFLLVLSFDDKAESPSVPFVEAPLVEKSTDAVASVESTPLPEQEAKTDVVEPPPPVLEQPQLIRKVSMDHVMSDIESFKETLAELQLKAGNPALYRQWENGSDLAASHCEFRCDDIVRELKEIESVLNEARDRTLRQTDTVWQYVALTDPVKRKGLLGELKSQPVPEAVVQKANDLRMKYLRLGPKLEKLNAFIDKASAPNQKRWTDWKYLKKLKCISDRLDVLIKNLYEEVSLLAKKTGREVTGLDDSDDEMTYRKTEEELNSMIELFKKSLNTESDGDWELSFINSFKALNLRLTEAVKERLPMCEEQRVIVVSPIQSSSIVRLGFVKAGSKLSAADKRRIPSSASREDGSLRPVLRYLANIGSSLSGKRQDLEHRFGSVTKKVQNESKPVKTPISFSTTLKGESASSTLSYKSLQQNPPTVSETKTPPVQLAKTTVNESPNVPPLIEKAPPVSSCVTSNGGVKSADLSLEAVEQENVEIPSSAIAAVRSAKDASTTESEKVELQPAAAKAVEEERTPVSAVKDADAKSKSETETVAPTVGTASLATAVSEDAKPAFTSNTSTLFSGLFPTSKVFTPPTESKAAVSSSAETKDKSVTSFSFAPTGKVEEQNDEMETADSKSAASVLSNFSFTTAKEGVGIGSFGGLGGQPSAEAASKNIFGGGVVASVPQKAVFGGASPFGATSPFGSFQGASPFGASNLPGGSSSTFGSPFSGVAAQPTAGPFSSGTVAQSGFVGSSPPGQPLSSGFGAAPTFGGSAFGQSSTFKTASPFSDRSAFGSNAPPPTGGFSAFAASSVPTFGSLAGSTKSPPAGFGSQTNAQQQSTFTQWRG